MTLLAAAQANTLPVGLVELRGAAGTGKSTLALQVAAAAQAHGHVVAFVDLDGSFAPERAERFGVNVARLLISQPDRNALELVSTLVSTHAVRLIFVDGADRLPPATLEGLGEIGRYADHAEICLVFTRITRTALERDAEVGPLGRALRRLPCHRLVTRGVDREHVVDVALGDQP